MIIDNFGVNIVPDPRSHFVDVKGFFGWTEFFLRRNGSNRIYIYS